MKNFFKPLILKSTILSFFLIIYSCNLSKNIPEGKKLLVSNKYTFKKNKFNKVQIISYTKQKPNNKILFFIPFQLMVFNMVPKNLVPVLDDYNKLSTKLKIQKSLDSLYVKYNLPQKAGRKNWVNKMLYKYGKKPVILDTALIAISTKNIQQNLKNKGFLNTKVSNRLIENNDLKKSNVFYDIDLGEPFKINNFLVQIKDSLQNKLYETKIKENSLIRKNDRYDLNNITKERERVGSFFKNNGYFKFDEDPQQINFYADTISDGTKKINLLLKISPKNKTKKDQKYYYDQINIFSQNQENNTPEVYKGYNLYLDGDSSYKPEAYIYSVLIQKDKLYKEEEVANSRRNILELDYFNLESFEVNKKENSDSLLIANIRLSKKKKNYVELFLESSYSELFSVGLSPGISFSRRNIFKRGESIRFSVKGTVGTVQQNNLTNTEFFNAYQVFFQSRLIFPYISFPFLAKSDFLKPYNPKSHINLGASSVKNIGLDRIDFSGSVEYYLSKNNTIKNILTPFGIKLIRNVGASNYLNIFTSDATLFNDLGSLFSQYTINTFGNNNLYNNIFTERNYNTAEVIKEVLDNNPNFVQTLSQEEINKFRNLSFRYQRITQDVLFSFFSYEFLYNEYDNKYLKTPIYFSGKVETGGNMLGLLDRTFNLSKDLNGSKSVFGVTYSQYVKFDLDFRAKWNLNINQQLIFRTYFGASIPYGNLNFNPFEKTYYAGGSNDVRAWRAYSLGVADKSPNQGQFAIGDLKLTTNLEYRFKLSNKFNGALFVDAGNIWTLNNNTPNEDTTFSINNFYNQLGIGPGIGIRYDLNYFILRFDWAYKLYDPAIQKISKWNVDNDRINLNKTTLNFSINYPF